MTHSWLSYLPSHLASDLLAHPLVSPLDQVLHQQAVALFADISGFTPMSEALGKVGPKGTEELSRILNHTFATLIEIIVAYGGSIGKFAGDALTVVFPYARRHEHATVRRAIQCALDMQAALTVAAEHQTSAGVFRLTMKIGLGMGDLLTTTVGDPSIRLEYLLAGSAIDRCVAAEHHAPQGAVVVSDALLPYAGARDVEPIADGLSRLYRLYRRPVVRTRPPLGRPDLHVLSTLVRYLPPTIAERVEQGQLDFVDEHRTVTTLFVHFDRFAYHDCAEVPRLQAYLADVVRRIERYGGYLRQVDVGDKGSLFIVLFGAPVAHEDDAERALLCAIDLRRLATERQVVTATGITSGRIFCGMVGSAVRREYAAIGDSVNLAARLMSLAGRDQILVDAATRQRARMPLDWQELPPLTVKGKQGPIAVAVLGPHRIRSTTRLRAPNYALPMVGRAVERADCLHRLQQVCSGSGQIVGITAEAGMGKSRLVAELLRSSTAKALRCVTGVCLSYGTKTSYLVWQDVFRVLFGLSTESSVDAQMTQVATALAAIDPALNERRPLLGAVLNLPIPENPFTRSLDAELRKSLLHALLIQCLRAWANQQPLLIILEDCHWIDGLSDGLLANLAQWLADVPLGVLITFRPFTTERSDSTSPLVAVRTSTRYHEHQLTTFSREETSELIGLKVSQLFGGATEVLPGLLDRIVERAQGNPFYIDELLNLLHDRGVDVRDPQALASIELPDSVQRLVLSRIDRLEEGPKTTLKRASILGRLFTASWLWQLAPELGDAGVVQGYLTRLQGEDFTQQEGSEPELTYLFKHMIIRDVAYESLSYATRAQLHEQVGRFIERTYGDELTRWLDLLAYHYGNSTNVPKQRDYFHKAGAAAQQRYANDSAIHYYRRLLAILPEAEQGETILALSRVQLHVGQWQAASDHARRALKLAEVQRNPDLAVRATVILGYTLRYMGRLDEELPLLQAAVEGLGPGVSPHAHLALLHELGGIHYYQGRYDEVGRLQEERVRISTDIADPVALCDALNVLALVRVEQDRVAEALALLERGEMLATEHQLLSHVALLVGNMGFVHMRLDAPLRALPYYQRQLELAVRINYQETIQLALITMGMAYADLGRGREATQCLLAGLGAQGDALGPRYIIAAFKGLAQIALDEGRLAAAEQLCRRGVALAHGTAQTVQLVSMLFMQTQVLLQQHRYPEALACAQEALEIAARVTWHEGVLTGKLAVLRIQVLLGELDAAYAIAQLEHVGSTLQRVVQQAACCYTIWQIDPQHGQARHQAAEHYAVLYDQSPKHAYRLRYRELTGADLSEPSDVPVLPTIVEAYKIDLDEVIPRVDRLLATTPPASSAATCSV